jgi:hypothetical protein
VRNILKKNLAVSFLVTAFLFIYIFFIFTLGYKSSDDGGMMRMVSGLYTGEPVEFMVFTNIIIGTLLKTLYQINRNFDWYSTYIYLVHFFSMWILLATILRVKLPSIIYNFLVFLFIFGFFEIRFLVLAQFTTTSAVAGCSGILAILVGTSQKQKSLLLSLAGVALIVISFMVRDQAFLLVLLPFLPLITYEFYTQKSRMLVGMSVVAFSLCLMTHQYNEYRYENHEGWKEFREYNSYRYKFQDYPIVDTLLKNNIDFSSTGLSKNDLVMLKTWYYTDINKYSKETFIKLMELNTPDLKSQFNWKRLSKFHLLEIQNYIEYVLFIMIFCCVFMVRFRLQHLVMLLATLISVVLIVYLCMQGRIVPRVSLPVLYVCLLTGLYLFLQLISESFQKKTPLFSDVKNYIMCRWIKKTTKGTNEDQREKIKKEVQFPARMVPLGLLLILSFNALYANMDQIGRASNSNIRKQRDFQIMIDAISQDLINNKENKKYTIIASAGAFRFGWIKPFKIYDELYKINVISLGWSTHTPIYREAMQRSGIKNIDTELYLRDDLLYSCPKSVIRLFKKYILENYQQEVEFHQVEEPNMNAIPVWKFYRVRLKKNSNQAE